MSWKLTHREHLAKAEEHQRFLDKILPDVELCPQWVATVGLYVALHLVDVLLKRKGLPTGSHKLRGDTLRGTPPYSRTIWPCYDKLLQASKSARYFSPKAFSTEYSANVVRDNLIGTYLKTIRAAVQKELDLLDGALESDLTTS